MNKYIIKILALICSIIFINRVLVITPDSLLIYYGIYFLALTVLILTSKVKPELIFVLLFLSMLASIVFNEVPTIYQPYARFLSFILIISLFSPFIRSRYLDHFRLQFLEYALKLIILLIVVSFVLMITGVVQLSYPYNGITVHSMILGPLAAISVLICLYRITIKKQRDLYLFIFIIIAFIMVLVSSSRGTLLSLIVSSLFLLYRFNLQLTKKRFTPIILILAIFLFSYPFWSPFIEGVQTKMTNNIKRGGYFSSRESIWLDRLDEFNSSPIFGIGFSNMKRDIFFSNDKSNIELGSSYLGVLSMTGIIGFLSLLLILFKYVYKTIINKHSTTFLLSSILIFLLIHMIFEGYIFGSGNSLMLLFWLLIGDSAIILEKDSKVNGLTLDNKYLFT